MPISLAIFAGGLKKFGLAHKVVDLFGINPPKVLTLDGSWLFGETLTNAIDDLLVTPSSIILYANQAANHSDLLSNLDEIKLLYPKSPIYLLENSQAVTAYSLESIKEHFVNFNIAGVITGAPDTQINYFVNEILKLQLQKIAPKACWDQFPLENYWEYKLAHGPQTSSKYLPILTSYGCPWGCSFCVVPKTNLRKWTGRSAEDVYEEVRILKDKYGVTEFHLEDLNSSVNTQRLLDVAEKLKPLAVIWKIVAGTKAETLDTFDTLSCLSDSGLRYFSFSPESGSKKVRDGIGKRFDIKHSFRLIRWSRNLNIKTQACFVLGMPEEKRIDRFKSLLLLRIYTILGIDEVAVFIISPIPGSKIYDQFEVNLKAISFSPSWRPDYKILSLIRIYWYFNFLILKLIFHPFEILMSTTRFFSKRFELKMELAPYRSRQWKKWAKKSNV